MATDVTGAARLETVADYRILGPAGSGSTGSFHVAVPPQRLGLDTDRVMLKIVPGVVDDDTFRKVARELRVFASVSSPYLVRLFDAGQDGTTFYYSMELMPLGSLAQPSRPLSRTEVLRAVRDAARAAHDLHQAGLAHRDIQPSSVLLHEGGAKLADLGLAQALHPDQTVTGLAGLDSVEYVDPAVLYGERPSRAADIYGLGATLHRALSGDGLYGYLPANEPLVAVRRVLTGTPTISAALSDAERSIVERCIDGDTSARFPTAADLAAALDALVSGEEAR
jgi:serine/threonine protein kinase